MLHSVGWGLYKMRKDVGRCYLGGFKHYTSSRAKQILVSAMLDIDHLLVPITFADIHTMSLVEFAKKYDALEHRAKTAKDMPWQKVYSKVKFLPTFLAHSALWIIGYLNMCIGIDLPMFGMKGEASGHFGVYDVGQYGLSQVLFPMTPFLRINNYVCMGKVRKVAAVVGDEIKAQNYMNISTVGDHRFGDASIWSPLAKVLTAYNHDPANWAENEPSIRARPHFSEPVNPQDTK